MALVDAHHVQSKEQSATAAGKGVRFWDKHDAQEQAGRGKGGEEGEPNGEETEAAAPVPSATPVKAAATEHRGSKCALGATRTWVSNMVSTIGTYGGSLFSPTAFDKAAKSASAR